MTAHDIFTIVALVFLEGVLSFDNAIVLAAMVSVLPKEQQKKALRYGMIGAFAFRFIAIFFLQFIMNSVFIKTIGGAYLFFLFIKHFFFEKESEDKKVSTASNFWMTIVSVELMDIVFSVDSILASVAMSSKVEIVLIGGILGIIMMRFAATIFIGLIERFPSLADTGFLLVGLIGTKLILEVSGINFHDYSKIYPYAFWVLFLSAIMYGFFKNRFTTIK